MFKSEFSCNHDTATYSLKTVVSDTQWIESINPRKNKGDCRLISDCLP